MVMHNKEIFLHKTGHRHREKCIITIHQHRAKFHEIGEFIDIW